MLQRFLLIALTLCSLSASAQWQLTGSKVRYVNGLGIPTKDTASGVSADSSQIQIRPQDSSLYIKYKRTWIKVGGTGFTGTGTANYIPKFTSPSVLGNSRIIDDGTNVGIGVTPGYPLHVAGSVGITSSSSIPLTYSAFNSTGSGAGITIGIDGAGIFKSFTGTSDYDAVIGTGQNGLKPLNFATNGFVRAAITTGGQFNIGGSFTSTNNTLQVTGNASIGSTTAAPANGLFVAGSTSIGTSPSGSAILTAGGRISSSITGGEAIFEANFPNNANFGTTSAQGINFLSNNTTRAAITTTGQVNIGGNFTSTNNTLQVAGNTAIGYTAAAPANGLLVAGNVGIGTITPNTSFNLDVTGSVPAVFNTTNTSTSSNYGSVQLFRQTNTAGAGNGISFGLFNSLNNIAEYGYIGSIIESNLSGGQSGSLSFFPVISGARSEAMRITSGGKVLAGGNTDNGAYKLQCNGTGVWGAGAYVNGSDSALKENIIPIDSSLQYVKLLKPVTYRYKKFYSSDSTIQTGFIAQDLMQVFKGKPLLEGLVKQGQKYYSVAYQNLIPIMVKAMQEQQAKIESLEQRISAIEAILKSNKIQ